MFPSVSLNQAALPPGVRRYRRPSSRNGMTFTPRTSRPSYPGPKVMRFADNSERIRGAVRERGNWDACKPNPRCTRAVHKMNGCRVSGVTNLFYGCGCVVSAKCPWRVSPRRVYRWLPRWAPGLRMFRSWEVSLDRDTYGPAPSAWLIRPPSPNRATDSLFPLDGVRRHVR